ncbi:MAG TPA: UDP-N-acetylglucosamine 1-carboxyvinyltransferase [Candidatus Paceibacterota bacterium]|nr:UDP-N-acetylglucosamine 1-carboxyvinyltransferase [Candidatus Paceibacterota bacterium]
MAKDDRFIITGLGGAKTLRGELVIGGAKNEVLKVLAGSILFCDELTLTNVPEIEDVWRMIELLKGLGIKVRQLEKNKYHLETKGLNNFSLASEISKKLRASIVVTGPLLARLGKVVFPYPGGCVIGKRPIDLFLSGFEKMGATITENEEGFVIEASRGKLQGAEIFFKNQSVTATETFIMAGVLAEGQTVLKNCALEPEIVSLGEWLNECGAKITGLGTSTITIHGGDLLVGEGKTHETLADRIEAGSFLILGALTAADLLIKKCRPEHLDALIAYLSEAGVKIEIGFDWIKVINKGDEKFTALDVKTHEYPGFPTDLQAPFAIFLTQADGQSYIFETIFEGRLNYFEALGRMGAKVKVLDSHRAIIDGPTPLSGREIESPDLRAGLAYVLAAIIASDESVVHNVEYIDRGYEEIEKRLASLGLDIKRISGNCS